MPSLAETLAEACLADPGVARSLTDDELSRLAYDWAFWARPDQLPPQGDWNVWMILAGRGWGKTRTGAQWCHAEMTGDTPMSAGRYSRMAIVATTAADARDVMVDGESGIMNTGHPDFRPVYKKSQRLLEWPNGAIALTFSAEEPDQLRGPQFDIAWVDEVAKMAYADETWDMLQFCLRLGNRPRQLVTTTPRPIPLVRTLIERARADHTDVVVTRGSTFDNRSNLADKFVEQIRRRYEGTRLGRQELYAEVLDDTPGALWTRAMLDQRSHANRLAAGMTQAETLPPMSRVVVGVDPSGNRGDDEKADSIGIVTVGQGEDGLYYVIEDATCTLGPAGWARQAVNQYRFHQADVIVGEKNFGGAMVEFTVRMVDAEVSFKDVSASRGKSVRAEPVAALYEQGRVRHAPGLTELEEQMVNFTRSGYVGSSSPDRADALVWAMTELALGDPEYDPHMLARINRSF